MQRGQGGGARIREILLNLGLAIDHHVTTAEPGKIDPMGAIRKRELETVVHQSFAHHAVAGAAFFQQIDRSPLEEPCANPRLT